MSRKDSRGMFANVLGGLAQETAGPKPAATTTSPHLMKVAAGVRQIQEKGEAFERLLKDGEYILDVDPADVAPSSIPDRFDGAYDAAAIDEISASIRERGQLVAGLVRPVRGGDYSYQIVFGRRRLAAAKALGIKFRAVVRDLTDEQAIVFQGEENTNRNDLSFIEKCVFALSQENAGYRRDVICASLSTGKSHLSEMLSIATSVPRETLVSIGASPNIGRRRWLEFVKAYAGKTDAGERVRRALDADLLSSERFAVALEALKTAEPQAVGSPARNLEIKANGFLLAKVSYPKSGPRIDFTKAVPPRFVEFLNDRMAALHSEFVNQRTDDKER